MSTLSADIITDHKPVLSALDRSVDLATGGKSPWYWKKGMIRSKEIPQGFIKARKEVAMAIIKMRSTVKCVGGARSDFEEV